MDTKTLIIDIASKLFQQKGYNGVGLSEILKECEISKGALYHHFPGGKEELLITCIQSMSETITQDIDAIFNSHPTTQEAIIAMIEKLIATIETEGSITSYTFTSMISEMGSLSEPVRDACSNLYEKIEEIYTNKLKEEGNSAETAHSAALLMTASIEGAIMLSLTKKNSEPLKILSNVLSNMF